MPAQVIERNRFFGLGRGFGFVIHAWKLQEKDWIRTACEPKRP
jgi:hypothetical protein